MTVGELIELLQKLPHDAPVVYQACSDYCLLHAYEIVFYKATDPLKPGNTPIRHHNMPGEFRMYGGPLEYKNQPLPVPVDVVAFPGN